MEALPVSSNCTSKEDLPVKLMLPVEKNLPLSIIFICREDLAVSIVVSREHMPVLTVVPEERTCLYQLLYLKRGIVFIKFYYLEKGRFKCRDLIRLIQLPKFWNLFGVLHTPVGEKRDQKGQKPNSSNEIK